MSNTLQFGGVGPTTQIVNAFSSGGAAPVSFASPSTTCNAQSTSVSVPSSGTWVNALSVTGSGNVSFLAFTEGTSTPRTISVRVTVDGTYTAFNATSAATSGTGNTGVLVIGGRDGSAVPSQAVNTLRYTTSLLVEVQQNIAGDSLNMYVVRSAS